MGSWNGAIVSYAFGNACNMTAKLDESFDAMFDAVRSRTAEIGGSTMADREAVSDMENAVAKMRHFLGPEMREAYLKIYAKDIEARNQWD